jgi:hypothetical protein
MLTIGDTYFETLNLRLSRGRALNSGDGLPGHEAAVVNQQFASRYFPSDDPIGRRILLTTDPPTPGAAWTTIVGVAPNVRQRDVREPKPDPVVYLPYRADPQRQATLLIRTVADPAKVTASVRDRIVPAGVVCVVDAETGGDTIRERETAREQVRRDRVSRARRAPRDAWSAATRSCDSRPTDAEIRSRRRGSPAGGRERCCPSADSARYRSAGSA